MEERRIGDGLKVLLVTAFIMMAVAAFPAEASAGDTTWATTRDDLLRGQTDVWIPWYGIKAEADDLPLEVPYGKDVCLRLIGNMDRGLSGGEPKENGYALIVKGSLTIIGSEPYDYVDTGMSQRYVGWHAAQIMGGNNTGNGGGIYVAPGGSLVIDQNTTVVNNFAKNGGGIYVDEGASLEIIGKVTGNTADSHGGGIYVAPGGTVKQTGVNAEVTGNKAWAGGGVYTRGTYDLGRQKIQSNSAEYGAGVHVAKLKDDKEGGKLITTGGEISKNKAAFNGGGVFVESGAVVDMQAGMIQDNDAGEIGGGIYSENSGDIRMSGGSIRDNDCNDIGGGIYSVNSNVTISGSPVIKNNKASGNKNDLFVMDGTIKVSGRVSDSAEIWTDIYSEKIARGYVLTEGALGKASPEVFRLENPNYVLVTGQGDGEVELVGKEDDNTHRVTFNTGEAGIDVADQIIVDGKKAVDPKPEYKGKVVSSWRITGGDTYNFYDPVKNDLDLTAAGWSELDEEYTINYVTGTDGLTYTERKVNVSEPYLDPEWKDEEDLYWDFREYGMTFLYWCMDKDLQVKYNGESCYDLAQYATEDRQITLYAKTEHSHKVNDGWVVFEPWASKDSLPSKAGNYYLLYDVILDGNDLAWSPTGEVQICLNGHKIERSRKELDDSVIRVKEKTTLCLHDCIGTGVITGGHAGDNNGGGVRDEGEFYMYGGTITGNTARNGGGVSVCIGRTFGMYGGTITGNSVPADGLGGGVFNDHYELLSYKFDSVFRTGSKDGSLVTIKDNKAGEKESNVYLPNKGDAGQIKIDGKIDSASRIGISVIPPANAGDGETMWITSGLGDNPLEVFIDDPVDPDAAYKTHISGDKKDGKYEAYIIVDKGGGGDDEELQVSPIKIAKTTSVKYKTLKKKSKTLSRNKIMTVKNAVGKLTYSKVSVNKSGKKFTVNKKTGALTVKKGTRKGLYKVKIRVTDSISGLKDTVTVKIKVK